MKNGVFGEDMDVLEAEGYDFELAGARLIARDAARVVSLDTQKCLREILESDGSDGRTHEPDYRVVAAQ